MYLKFNNTLRYYIEYGHGDGKITLYDKILGLKVHSLHSHSNVCNCISVMEQFEREALESASNPQALV